MGSTPAARTMFYWHFPSRLRVGLVVVLRVTAHGLCGHLRAFCQSARAGSTAKKNRAPCHLRFELCPSLAGSGDALRSSDGRRWRSRMREKASPGEGRRGETSLRRRRDELNSTLRVPHSALGMASVARQPCGNFSRAGFVAQNFCHCPKSIAACDAVESAWLRLALRPKEA